MPAESDTFTRRLSSTTATDTQGQADSRNAGGSKQQKLRHRASVACAVCRERRIRCVVPSGESACQQCQKSSTECVIKNDDERRRPISRAYMTSLTDRVALLESMLKEAGTDPPPVVHPPKTTRGTLYVDGDDFPAPQTGRYSGLQSKRDSAASVTEDNSPRSMSDEASAPSNQSYLPPATVHGSRSETEVSIGTPIDDKKDGLVTRLLSTRGHLSFDQLSGRLRFFGGTVNCHVFSELEVDDAKSARDTLEQAKRAERCIRALPIETHDYLMQLFWHHYNSVLHVVHEDAFNEDREQGRTQFYSGFLHVCMLAMAYRFADKLRLDIQRIALPDRESILHREAKYMLDLELEQPGGIPSIAALLILGDSEVGVGRDNVGWMYSGMAMRLCYDLGLQLDSRGAGLSSRENDVRKMTLWACVIYDRYWALFLGRPLTMKSADLEIYTLSDQFERLGTCMPAGTSHSLHTRIYEALIDLMEIAGKIVEQQEFRKQFNAHGNPEQQAFFKMAALDRELRSWATRLPADLKYTEENRALAPISFYLLHQQYNAILILLHRPFARYDDYVVEENDDVNGLDTHFSKASRTICTKSAIAMARIFWQHRQRFDGKKIFCVGMQHCGVAATALIAALASNESRTDRNNNMQYLEVLHASLQDMAECYQPAERMAAVLDAVMIELRGDPISPAGSNVPARRYNDNNGSELATTKRPRQSQAASIATPVSQSCSSADVQNPSRYVSQSLTHQHSMQTSDYIFEPPRNEISSWSNTLSAQQVHGTVMHTQQHIENTADICSTNKRQEWTNQFGHDFPRVPPMTEIPGLPDGNVANLDFLQLPSEEDWARWHAVPGAEIASDLQEQQRGRYSAKNLHSPPMAGMSL